MRTLAGAQHIQTHTIPQLASTAADMEQKGGGGLFGKLLGKKEAGAEDDRWEAAIRISSPTKSGRSSKPRPSGSRNRSTCCSSGSRTSSSSRNRHGRSVGHTDTVVLGSADTVVLGSRPGRPSLGSGAAVRTPVPDEPAASGGGSAWESPFEWRPSHGAGQRRCGFGHAVAHHQRSPGGTRRRSGRAGPAGAKRAAGPRRGGRATPARGGSRGRAAARGGSRTRARGRRGASP